MSSTAPSDNLSSVLRAHAAAYPGMEPTDAVKLIYQGVFGGGHLIADRAACTARLIEEYRSAPQTNGPLCEIIEPARGIVRVSLCALDAHGVRPEALAEAFLRSAAHVTGSITEFLSRLDILRAVTNEGTFGFDRAALDAYLSAYLTDRPPLPVSHSTAYRTLYAPHYRVLLADDLPRG